MSDNEPKGKAKGGAARAKSLTIEQRKEISTRGVQAKRHLASLPKASHKGEVKIGDMSLACCVLEDGRRLISELAINSILGSAGGKSYRLRDATSLGSEHGPLPLFLSSKALQPFISAVFEGLDLLPIEYNDKGRAYFGFEATILPKVCEVWLQASEKGKLQDSQLVKAKKAEILIRGLARVGIIALVDEATGYQKDRARDALAQILEAFVAKELQPYVKTFPSEYYEHLFRIYGLPYPPPVNKGWRPSFFGKITNEVIYARLAPELLPDLKRAASKTERKAKLFQWLTQDIGHPRLKEHLTSIVTLLKISSNPKDFMRWVNQVHPRYGEQLQMQFDDPNQARD
jgi:hypothetical protein